MQNKLPRLAVRDSFDDEDLSDIDDEVFIRDGKNGILKIDDDCVVKRPLMAPRRKFKNVNMTERVVLPYRALLAPICYGLIALLILLGLIVLCALTVNLFPMPLTIIRKFLSHGTKMHLNKTTTIPCTSLSSKIIWTKTLPKLTSEAPLRSNDVNGDNIDDIIAGFSTGLDATDSPDYVCNLYFKDQKPCFGGVLALNGKSGDIIWTHWTSHAIFSVDCNLDLTGDSTKDCIISGRGGILHAVNGRNGISIWEIPRADKGHVTSDNNDFPDIYDAKFIVDIDNDRIGDIIASHIIQTDEKLVSEIVIVSGKSGKIIRNVQLPDTEELFVAPQVLVHPDGENIFVIVTNSQKQSGGLYVIRQAQLMQGELKLRKLHHSAGKGVLLAPILVDINLDGTEDIVAAMFNSTIVAYDGKSFQQIWNYTIPNSEVISIPIPGYYDDDNIPDFMVKHQIGPGFPVYYYTEAMIISGKTGKPLLEEAMRDSMSAQMSGLSISVQGFGNDWFLHWSADCLNHEGSKDKYQFFKGQSSNSQTRADLCRLRFNSTLITRLFAFSQHVGPPGIPLYKSEEWKKLEFNNSFDAREAAENYFENHPLDEMEPLNENDDVSERSPKIRKNSQLGEKFPVEDDFLGKYDIEDYKDEEPQIIGFEDKVPDDMSFAEELRDFDKWDDELRPKKIYDVLYDDDSERLSPNEMRSQRSDKLTARINNNTNDVQNKLDPSMDYTNGQSKRYYSLEPVNRTNSLDENSDYFNMPDIDFTDDSEEITKVLERRDTKRHRGQKEIPIDTQNGNYNNWIKLDKKFKQKVPDKKVKPTKKKITIESTEKTLFRSKRIRKRSTLNTAKNSLKQDKNLGIQRQPPTGILLPSLKSTQKRSIDLVFSTYWLPATETPIILLQRDLDCIQTKEDMQITTYEEKVKDCLAERGVNYKYFEEVSERENLKVALGQMTIYRMQLQCACPQDILPGDTCKDILRRQSWSAHLGSAGNGYFRP